MNGLLRPYYPFHAIRVNRQPAQMASYHREMRGLRTDIRVASSSLAAILAVSYRLAKPASLTVYGADPAGSPQHAWKVVRKLPTLSAGSLFLKTHPASPWVLFDMTLSTDAAASRQLCAYSKQSGTVERCFAVSTSAPALHPEFNRAGT